MITLNPIGIIHSPYQEKFGIPRQPNLVPAGKGELHLIAPYNHPDIVRGLEQFSHLWLLFIFTQTMNKGWKNTVRPPRLGGNEKLGVFATRSTFRPNPIGLSAVELNEIITQGEQIILKLGSLDLMDGTPIIDIKPYIPYSDSYPNASAGYSQMPPNATLQIQFTELALNQLAHKPQLHALISQVIAQDPRPAYKKSKTDLQIYGLTLDHHNIKWSVSKEIATILSVESN